MDEAEFLDKQRLARSKVAIKDEQSRFVIDGIDDPEDSESVRGNKKDRSDIKHNFFPPLLRTVLRVHVPVGEIWYVYRNGKLCEKLEVGMHVLWNWVPFLTKWQVRRVNVRTVMLPALANGRVEGPELPHGSERGANMSLALDVGAEFRLLCRITNIEKFLSHEFPIKVFYASFNDIVQEQINKLPYDQYGRWATLLRNKVEEDLTIGKDNTQALIGVSIEKVFVDSFAFSGEHHAEVLKLYQLTETGKRELEGAISLGKQGQLLDIAPSILALQNNEIGRELIRHDAKLRELMIAVGIRTGGTLPIPGTHITEANSFGYLSSPPSRQLPPISPNPYPYTNSNTGEFTGPLPWTSTPPVQEKPQPPYGSQAFPGSGEPSDPFNAPPSAALIQRQRQEMDVKKLREAGFTTHGWGPLNTFDPTGQPGTIMWSLQVHIQRDDGHLVILFQSSQAYPTTAPDVQVRTSQKGWQNLWPATITNWRPESSLVEVVQELDRDIKDS